MCIAGIMWKFWYKWVQLTTCYCHTDYENDGYESRPLTNPTFFWLICQCESAMKNILSVWLVLYNVSAKCIE